MIGLLQSILCVLQNILLSILWAGATVVNGLVAAIGLLVAAIISLLPAMPAAPDSSALSSTALGWVAWFMPVGGIVGGLAAMLALYIIFRLVKLALNWAKAM